MRAFVFAPLPCEWRAVRYSVHAVVQQPRGVRRRLLLTKAHLVRQDDVNHIQRASRVLRSSAVSTERIRINMKERTMRFIPTTATAVEKFKQLAKARRDSTGESLAVALDIVAREQGYDHWKHVKSCAAKTARRALPVCLQDILDRADKRDTAKPESRLAFSDGLVIAMDVKDADGVAVKADWVDCEDGWYLAARDIWASQVHCPDSETGTTLLDNYDDPQELAQWALDDLTNYRLFRYVGADAPADLTDACRRIHGAFFFPPTNIWLRREFIEAAESSEVRKEWRGSVVYWP